MESQHEKFRQMFFGASNISMLSRRVLLLSCPELLFITATDQGELISAVERMDWSVFEMSYVSEKKGEDSVAFRSAHGYYMCAEQNNRVVCNRDVIGPWEKFRIQPVEQLDKHNFKVALHAWNEHILSVVGPMADVLSLDARPTYSQKPTHPRRDNEHFVISFLDTPSPLSNPSIGSGQYIAAVKAAKDNQNSQTSVSNTPPQSRRQLSEVNKEIVGAINSGERNLCFLTAPLFGLLFSTVALDGALLLANKNKSTDSSPASSPTWNTIAREGQEATLPSKSRVRYGCGTRWVERIVSGKVSARNDIFGDPAPGAVKVLQVLQEPSEVSHKSSDASAEKAALQLKEVKRRLTDLFNKARNRTFLEDECNDLRVAFRAGSEWCVHEAENRQQDSLDFFLKLLEYCKVPDFFALHKQTFHGGLPADHDSGVDQRGHALFLDVPFQGQTTLKNLLAAHMERTTPPVKRKVLLGDTASEQSTPTLQFFSFAEVPKLLIVALKRFAQQDNSSKASKLKTFVDWPFILPTRVEDLVQPSGVEVLSKSAAERGLMSLRMIVCHHGSTPNSGHYTVYYFDRDTHSLMHFDDLMDAELNPDAPLGGTKRVNYEDVRASIATDGYFGLYELEQQQTPMSATATVSLESKVGAADMGIPLRAVPDVALLDQHLRTKRELQLARLELADHMRTTNASGLLSPLMRRGKSARMGFSASTLRPVAGTSSTPDPSRAATLPSSISLGAATNALPTPFTHEQTLRAAEGVLHLLTSGNGDIEDAGVKALDAILSSKGLFLPLTASPVVSALQRASSLAQRLETRTMAMRLLRDYCGAPTP